MTIKSMNALKKRFSRNMLKDSSGNVAMIAALSIIPIITVVGLAVDFQLIITKKNVAQQTLDVTMIAAARERQGGASESEVQVFAADYFETLLAANDPQLNCASLETSSEDDSEEINGLVNCNQPTTLSAIFGKDSVDFQVTSGSTFGVGQVDVAFVFDLSGSMNQNGRLPALREAAEDAFEVLLAADNTQTNAVRIAISSYNHSVNVGDYFERVVDFNRRPAQQELSEVVGDLLEDQVGVVQIDARDNRRFFDYETVSCTSGNNRNCRNYVDIGARFYPAQSSSCVYSRLGGDALTDNPPVENSFMLSDQPIWTYDNNLDERNRPNDFNAKRRGQFEVENRTRGQFRRGNGAPGGTSLRNSSAPNNSTPSSAAVNRNGGNFDESNNALTYHARIRENVPNRAPRDEISNTRALNGCPETGEILPLTDRLSTLTNYTRDMRAGGATAGHLGIAWAWYMLSPKWNSVWPNASEPLEYFEQETAKAMIIMTDGVFNATHPNAPKNSNETAADYCRQIKAETNIRIYTIGFDVPTRSEDIDGVEVQVPNLPLVEGTDQNILEFCASDPEQTAFDASGREELRDAYTQIAAEISDLRISN